MDFKVGDKFKVIRTEGLLTEGDIYILKYIGETYDLTWLNLQHEHNTFSGDFSIENDPNGYSYATWFTPLPKKSKRGGELLSD